MAIAFNEPLKRFKAKIKLIIRDRHPVRIWMGELEDAASSVIAADTRSGFTILIAPKFSEVVERASELTPSIRSYDIVVSVMLAHTNRAALENDLEILSDLVDDISTGLIDRDTTTRWYTEYDFLGLEEGEVLASPDPAGNYTAYEITYRTYYSPI